MVNQFLILDANRPIDGSTLLDLLLIRQPQVHTVKQLANQGALDGVQLTMFLVLHFQMQATTLSDYSSNVGIYFADKTPIDYNLHFCNRNSCLVIPSQKGFESGVIVHYHLKFLMLFHHLQDLLEL